MARRRVGEAVESWLHAGETKAFPENRYLPVGESSGRWYVEGGGRESSEAQCNLHQHPQYKVILLV